jgi:nitrate reductase gamma subunit
MQDILTGPMIWLSLSVFVFGMLARIIFYIRGLDWKLDRVAYRAHPKAGMKGAARSIIYWLLPFATKSWRKQPVMTVVFFMFHLGAILVPLFLLAHNMILKEMFDLSFPVTLHMCLADLLSWGVIISGIVLILRRISLPEVRILTTTYDYFILFLALAPFVTGLFVRYELGDYQFWYTMHLLSGALFLLLAPFTKLSHIVLFFMSRTQLGMDFGIKRGGMKEGTSMAW